MDGDTKAVLFSQNMHARRPMASTTKIMTALIALESGTLEDQVTVSDGILTADGSSIGLREGDVVPMRVLLAALLLESANDAAVAIAEHIGGSVSGFAELMNTRAQQLGAKNTHFTNPHGLYEKNHYSSAYDLGLITAEAFNYPLFAELVATKKLEVTLPSGLFPTTPLFNHNKLLWREDYVDGVKTGYVKESGHCLVASGSKNGWRLIAVVLDSPEMYDDAKRLLEYGYLVYGRHIFAEQGAVLGQAKVKGGKRGRVPAVALKTLACITGPQMEEDCSLQVELEALKAPVAKGLGIGEARLVRGDKVLVRTALVAGEEVERSWLKLIFTWLFRIVVGLTIFVFTVRTCAKAIKARRRRRRLLAAQSRRPNPVRPPDS
jgi:D-alanyl-D-alanine carboxypeptidase (penicillin-binding protein 5/6)